jgi:hypothetical protein
VRLFLCLVVFAKAVAMASTGELEPEPSFVTSAANWATVMLIDFASRRLPNRPDFR